MKFEVKIIEYLRSRRDVIIKRLNSNELNAVQSLVYSYERKVDALNLVIEMIGDDIYNVKNK